jgi:hypothetical protein
MLVQFPTAAPHKSEESQNSQTMPNIIILANASRRKNSSWDEGRNDSRVISPAEELVRSRIFLKSRGACRCEAVYAEAALTQARRLLHSHRTLVRNDIATDFKKSV